MGALDKELPVGGPLAAGIVVGGAAAVTIGGLWSAIGAGTATFVLLFALRLLRGQK
jgi:hypothetical protein